MESRVVDMKERRESGETLAQIGEAYGLTRERVRQILEKTYGDTSLGYAEAKRSVKQKMLDEYREEVLTKLRESPGSLSPGEITRDSPVPIRSASALLGSENWILTRAAQKHASSAVSDEQIAESLQRVWKSVPGYPDVPLSRVVYDNARSPQDLSGGRITQRMRWSDACKMAGIPVRESRRIRYPSAVSTEVAIGWIARFLADTETGKPTGAHVYEVWARRTPGAPSLATIQNVSPDETWATLRAQAVSRTLSGDVPDPSPVTTRGYSDKEIAEWVKAHEEGKSVAEVSRMFDVPTGTVRYYVQSSRVS
jgi:hypothetical protein